MIESHDMIRNADCGPSFPLTTNDLG